MADYAIARLDEIDTLPDRAISLSTAAAPLRHHEFRRDGVGGR